MLRSIRRTLARTKVFFALLAVLFAVVPIGDAFACGPEPASGVFVCVDAGHGSDQGERGPAGHGPCQHGHCHQNTSAIRTSDAVEVKVTPGSAPPSPVDSALPQSLPPSGLQRPPRG